MFFGFPDLPPRTKLCVVNWLPSAGAGIWEPWRKGWSWQQRGWAIEFCATNVSVSRLFIKLEDALQCPQFFLLSFNFPHYRYMVNKPPRSIWSLWSHRQRKPYAGANNDPAVFANVHSCVRCLSFPGLVRHLLCCICSYLVAQWGREGGGSRMGGGA